MDADTKATLRDLEFNANRWHARLALWVGANPKKATTFLLVASALAGWKVADLVRWIF